MCWMKPLFVSCLLLYKLQQDISSRIVTKWRCLTWGLQQKYFYRPLVEGCSHKSPPAVSGIVPCSLWSALTRLYTILLGFWMLRISLPYLVCSMRRIMHCAPLPSSTPCMVSRERGCDGKWSHLCPSRKTSRNQGAVKLGNHLVGTDRCRDLASCSVFLVSFPGPPCLYILNTVGRLWSLWAEVSNAGLLSVHWVMLMFPSGSDMPAVQRARPCCPTAL